MKKNYSKSIPKEIVLKTKEINTQKKDISKKCFSNSQFHYKDITSNNYNHRIRLDPSGETKCEVRQIFPISHVHSASMKANYLSKIKNHEKSAYDNAEIQSKIVKHLKKQNHQNLLQKKEFISQLCNNKNREIKGNLEQRKNKLKEVLTRLINDALLFAKKNNPVRSMLPDNINEIVEKAKKETRDVSLSLSNLSRISSLRGESQPKKNEFLTLLGVDLENLTINHVKFDIDKVWNFVNKIAKGRNIEELLRNKVVNAIMSMTEKKAAERARKIYEKLDIYNKYMARKKREGLEKKQKEEEEKYEEMMKNNPKEFIKLKMMKSLNEQKDLNKNIASKKKTSDKTEKNQKKKKKLKKSASAIFSSAKKHVIRLHSYKDVNQIMTFIDESKRNSQSKLYKKHFTMIQMTKSMDMTLDDIRPKNSIKCN